MHDRFSPVLAALDGAFLGIHLAEKTPGIEALEKAIALERACSAFELLAEAARANPWVKELSFRWRSTSAYSDATGLKIAPGLAEPRDPDSRSSWDLSAIIEFSIAATRLADGDVFDETIQSSRNFSDALRPSFLLAAREPAFSGRAARSFKAQLDLAERELSRSMSWACRADSSWMPSTTVAGGNWEKKANKEQIQSSQEMATLLGWPALAAEIERRALGSAAPNPGAADTRRAAL